MRKLNFALLLLGLGLLGYLFWRIGPRSLGEQVLAFGWGLILLIVSEGVSSLAHTIGWRHCLHRTGAPVPLFRLFRMGMAGYALNYLLPAASMGGEASKAALLASVRPGSEAVSSVLLDKLSIALAHLVLALLGAVFVLSYAHLPSQMWTAMAVTTVLLAGGIGGFLLIQRHGKLGAVLRWLTKRGYGGAVALRVANQISEVDGALKRFYCERPVALVLSVSWHLIGHSAALLQAWLFLFLLNQPAALSQVACAGFLSLWFDLLTFAVPLNLGTLEGSRIVALKTIGNDASLGMAFGVSIRITQLFWACFGLVSYAFFVRKPGWRGRSSSLPPQTDLSAS